MVKTFEKEIDGRTYRATPLLGMPAAVTFPRIMRLLGPALGELMKAAADAKTVADVKMTSMTGALQLLSAGLTETEVKDLFKTFLASAFVDDRELWGQDGKRFNLEMQGCPMTSYKVLWWAISEVNYGDFFGGILGKSEGSEASVPPSEASNT